MDSPHEHDPPEGTGGPEAGPGPSESGLGAAGRRAVHEIVHIWIPLAIVIVSVLAAVMGWRASLAEEGSAHSEELSRQDLIQKQQQLIQDNDAVDTDLRTFGQFTQYSSLAHSLLADADRVGGPAGSELRTEGQADLGIARVLGKQIQLLNYTFDPSSPTSNSNLRSDGTYAPGHPYDANLALDVAENADLSLHGLAPEQLHTTAEDTHTKAVDLTGIAALFIAVMVLLTLGAIVPGPPKTWLAGSGATLAIVGVVLFVIVQAS